MSRKSKPQETKDVIHHKDTALLIIDMLNTLEFPQGRKLLAQAKPVARRIARLKDRAKKKKIPVIYVNDNFGQWRSDWAAVYSRCLAKGGLGRELAQPLEPASDDYFVLKPKHSAFYSTSLEVLLKQIGVDRLIITGIAADICILFSVYDAYVRGYTICVPRDCVASETATLKRNAVGLMKKAFKVKTPPSASVKF
ncbi:MAG: cysteine hydrolase family protein [Bdellovibrionales bacterium]